MKIAICDDDVSLGSKIQRLVDQAFEGNASAYSCEVFLSADALLAHLTKNPLAFQIYLLDIEMAGTNGLEAAARIRGQDEDAVIIFLTSHAELMPEAFEVLAFQYLVKPFDDEKIVAVLRSARRHLQSRRKLYQYTARKISYAVYLRQIETIESNGRKIVLHLRNGECREYYGTLKEAAQKTADSTFVQVHHSFIVNLQHLAAVSSGALKMQSGVEIPVGGKFHGSFHAAYRKFVLSQSGL